MNITATFESIEELKAFAALIGQDPIQTELHNTVDAPAVSVIPTAPITAQVAPAAPAATAPQIPLSNPQQAPVSPQMPGAVQTTAPTYTRDDLSRAAVTLMESGRQDDLLALLARFGVEALTQLPQQHYGAFATELRRLGAQI